MVAVTNVAIMISLLLMIIGVVVLLVTTGTRNNDNRQLMLLMDWSDDCSRTSTIMRWRWWLRWLHYNPSCICSEASLRDTIQQASQLSSTTTIVLCGSSNIDFTSAMNLSYTNLYINCVSPTPFWNTEYSTDTPPCVINGNNQTRFFIGTNAHVTLKNIHFISGNANPLDVSTTSTTIDGGAIHLIDSTLTIEQCIFENNFAYNGAGGAIFMIGRDSRKNNTTSGGSVSTQTTGIRITNSSFIQNHANDGGAIALKYMMHPESVNVRSTQFIRNTATSAAGAVIFNHCKSVDITNTTFHQNRALSVYGGALTLYRTQIQFIGTIFLDNTIIYNSSLWNMNNNMYIYDNGRPGYGGSYVDCDEDTLFCHDTTTTTTTTNMNPRIYDTGIIEINTANTTVNTTTTTYTNHNCHLDGTIVILPVVSDDDDDGRCVL